MKTGSQASVEKIEEVEETLNFEALATRNEVSVLPQETIAELLEPINRIKVESVLSRYPIHNLTKLPSVEILIQRSGEKGELEFHWEVSPNAKSGQPRTLAYRIDCLVVNRRIDDAPRPLPSLIRLGSLRQICEELEIVDSGKNKQDIKNALKQNAGAMISAKLIYRGRDNSEHKFEHYFNRYNVIFTGDMLSDGQVADAVYVSFTEPFRQLLNNAPTRPLDYDYLKALTPMAQRFYELLTYRVYRAIKAGEAQARLLYSEFCLAVPQERKFTPRDIRRQMGKVNEQHLTAGYISNFDIEAFTDDAGKPDFWLLYGLGPRAYAEFRAFNAPTSLSSLEDKSREAQAALPARSEATAIGDALAAPPSTAQAGADVQAAAALVEVFQTGCGRAAIGKPRPRELTQAAVWIERYGYACAQQMVIYALAAARKSNFEMRHFGALLSYEQEAAAHCQQGAPIAPTATPITSPRAVPPPAQWQQEAERYYEAMTPLERAEREARANQLLENCNLTSRPDWDEQTRPELVRAFVLNEIREELQFHHHHEPGSAQAN